MHILIEASRSNARAFLDALHEAGLGAATLVSAEGVLSNEITVFRDQVRIDVQTSTPGLTFGRAWDRRVTMTYKGQDFYVACRADLIALKRASGRDVDLEEVRLSYQTPTKHNACGL